MGHQSKNNFAGGYFTDRDHGEGLVLSDNRAASWAGKSKYIIPHGIHSAGNGSVEGELLGMCQNITHG